MKRNKHTSSKVSHSTVSAIAIGVAITVVLTVILSAALTSLVTNGSIGENKTSIYIFVIRAASVLLGGIAGSAIIKEKYLQTIGIITLVYFVILLGMGITLYDGSFQHFGSGIISTLIGGAGAYLIQLRPRGRRKHAVHYKG